jgi:hypothetical protein
MSTIGTGTALLMRDPRMGQHLFFVLTDPDTERKVVTVILVTAKRHTDKTVELNPGDHPFIRHRSNVDYGTARVVPVSRLQSAVDRGGATLQPKMSDMLISKVRAGLLDSSYTIHAVVDYCRPLFSGE